MREALLPVLVVIAASLVCSARAAERPTRLPTGIALPGEAADLAPWAYVWRADRKVQPQPEACFMPRRLERLDRIYRTAADVLPPDQLKSIYYDMPDLLKRLPQKPKGRLLTGLLWTGGLTDYRIELRWPRGAKVPPPERVEVRSYPTSYGWFGFTVDRVLGKPAISEDGRVWTYRSTPGELMDHAYNVRVPAATEMIAVFCEPDEAGSNPPVPDVHLFSDNLGLWQQAEIEIEWGFDVARRSVSGRLEPSVAQLGSIEPLAGDTGTTVTGRVRWRSEPASSRRRGIRAPLLWAPNARPGLDSRVTVWIGSDGVTISVKDLERGPMLLRRHGLYVVKPGGPTAREFIRNLDASGMKSVRQMTREHREPGSFDELMREARLWTCPPGTELKPFPKVPDPPMRVSLSDEGWTSAWRAAVDQLTGPHMWGGLAFEVARVTRAMEYIGLHHKAAPVYKHFLDSPGAKPDGDYSDGNGALEWATSMRHDMGYSHDGTHASTGRLLLSMVERCLILNDGEWFRRNLARLQAAADWIIRQRTTYMQDVPDRRKLLVAGLMPPCMLGDYAIPSCDWHWYYVDNVLALQGLQRFADALALWEPGTAPKYRREAEAFRKDLKRVVDREFALSPVRLGRDGAYHSFLPRMAYARGLIGPELGAPQFPECDWWMGALPLAEPYTGIAPDDPRMVDTLDMMEELGTSPERVKPQEDARSAKGLSAQDAFFWHSYSILPKASHTANVYLMQDDVPGFLRFWINQYAAMVGADGKLWEHAHLGGFDPCAAPDNGTAGWFVENFRNMLVMEDGTSLWIARATPRAWLEHGKSIEVSDAPTLFGPLGYTIESQAHAGTITAKLDLPDRNPPAKVILRLRHPDGAPMRAVTVNGKPWRKFDSVKETITLTGLRGQAEVVATY